MKLSMRVALLLALWWVWERPATAQAVGANLDKVDRTIKKEPGYQSKSPRYALLVFGPQAKDRVWLVHDGDTLYVDRDGNGDLSDPAAKVKSKVTKDQGPAGTPYRFEVGELRVGAKVHKGLTVWAPPMTQFGDLVKARPNAKAALAADPSASVYMISLQVDWPGLKGQGLGGRVQQSAGVLDGNGALLFAAKPADAPVIHFHGPLEVTFYDQKPALRLDRDNNIYLVVGTPGHGLGTFAMLVYEETIPNTVMAKVAATFPAAQKNAPPLAELFELKERC